MECNINTIVGVGDQQERTGRSGDGEETSHVELFLAAQRDAVEAFALTQGLELPLWQEAAVKLRAWIANGIELQQAVEPDTQVAQRLSEELPKLMSIADGVDRLVEALAA